MNVNRQWSRRQLLASSTAATSIALAGCSSDGGGSPDDNEESPEENEESEANSDADEVVAVGEGSYRTTRPDAEDEPPSDVYVADERSDEPIPTNDWWSTLVWSTFGETLWSHPIVSDPGPEGLRIGRPDEWETTDEGPAGPEFAHFPSAFELTLGVEGAQFDETVVTDWGDWSVSFALRGEDATADVTLVKGSPYVFADVEGGPAALSFDAVPEVWADDGATLGVTVAGTHYGLFAPPGRSWSGVGTDTLTNDLGDGGYLTVAALPDSSEREAALETFAEHAHAHVVDTRVDWEYDRSASEVRTTYSFEVDARDGDASETITGLFPHQHKYADADLLGHAYPSVRGRVETVVADSVAITQPFPGLLPYLPDVGGFDRDRLRSFVRAEADKQIVRAHPDGNGVYWRGKNYNRATELVPLARHAGADDAADEFLDALRSDIEAWFSAEGEDGTPATTRVFYYNDTWGTVIGYPAGFGATENLNDHHFHYGYFVSAAATIARNDPEWAEESAWGGMVDLLVRDFACPDRDDDMFPFLRTFDPYEGHSWAGGDSGGFAAGNNQESSSEAINAYAALLEWGAYTGDEELRDLGAFLYTQEVIAAREYWFDVDDENLPELDEWSHEYAPMVWGNGYHFTTWWTDNPEAIYGINWLPIGGHSLYLGADEEYAGRTFDRLADAGEGDEFSYWPDQVWKYRTFSDPADAADRFAARGEDYQVEFGDSRAHTYHWISTLDAIGGPEPSVTADHALAAAFETDGTRTYVAYNPDSEPRTVTFSDGTELDVEPGTMATR